MSLQHPKGSGLRLQLECLGLVFGAGSHPSQFSLSHWELEIGHGGSVYTTDSCKCCIRQALLATLPYPSQLLDT